MKGCHPEWFLSLIFTDPHWPADVVIHLQGRHAAAPSGCVSVYHRRYASSQPHYDVVELDRIVCRVLLQQDPLKAGSGWPNHFVAPYSL